VVPQPNYFGLYEDVHGMTDWAHSQNAVVIGLVNPMSLALLSAPGNWGEKGADICCGEGQSMGVPLSSGGPYYGFLTCKQPYVRNMPGRIVGMTTDVDGKEGFVLTYQAREQHIRRAKATSNICTNQGLAMAAATIYLSLLGPDGLASVAGHSHANTQKLVAALTAIDGVEPAFSTATFHEAVLTLPKKADDVLAALADKGILGGLSLAAAYGMENAVLVCATEVRTDDEIAAYAAALKEVLA